MKHLLATLAVLAVVALLSPAPTPVPVPSAGGTFVVADPADPYRELAEEIARAEGVPLTDSPLDALARDPDYLLWVASPDSLSDPALVAFARELRARASTVAVGIITGGALEDARALWRRAKDVRAEHLVAANAANESARIAARLLRVDAAGSSAEPLNKSALLAALPAADYLTFTGHGGTGYLRLDEATTIRAADLPDLPPLVIATASCQTLQPWKDNSIALAFVDRGAAAYAGFVYSPNEGYLLGEFDGMPFRYTWPGFTIGDAVQVQNRGTLKGFAAFPYYFMLGDPRIALAAAAPYQLIGDTLTGGVRTLSYTGAPAGIIPVHIPAGARYTYVEIPGVAAASGGDPFYNARLQFADRGADKLVLFAHRGGNFQVRLQAGAPAGWAVVDLLADSLDHTLIFTVSHGEAVGLVAAVPLLVAGAWLAWRRRARPAVFAAAAAVGLAFAVLHAGYMGARLGEVTITSKPLQFSPVGVAVTGLLAASGALLWQVARSRRVRALAVLGATFPVWAAAGLWFAMATFVNILFGQHLPGASLYNYVPVLMALPALGVEAAAYALAFAAAGLTSHPPTPSPLS